MLQKVESTYGRAEPPPAAPERSSIRPRSCLQGGVVAACAGTAPQTSGGSAAPGAETTFQRVKRLKAARIGFINEPPFSIATTEKVSGIDPEIMRAFLASQGVDTVDGVLMEFASLTPALAAGRIDAIAS